MPNAAPIDPVHLAYARTKKGIREIPGAAVDPWIAHCFALCGLAGANDDTTAWCSAGMNGIFIDCLLEGTHSAAARSWAHNWGIKLVHPVHGCVLVFERPPNPKHGHVTLYDATLLEETPAGELPCFGCNQHNKVCDAFYPAALLIGPYWPSDVALPEDAEVAP